MPVLREPRLELFARELAALLNDMVAPSDAAARAGEAAGYPVGKSRVTFEANCRKRAQREDVKARVDELRAPGIKRAEEGLGISAEYLLAKLDNLTNFNVADYLSGPDKKGVRHIDLSSAPRELLGRLAEATQDVSESGAKTKRRTIMRTRIKGFNVIDGIRLMAQIKGLMAPEKRDLTIRPADNMSDDELARIAAGSGSGAPAAPVTS